MSIQIHLIFRITIFLYRIAAGCALIWNVSSENMEDEKYEGLWKLTLLCACCQVVPLLFVKILPENNEEQVYNKYNIILINFFLLIFFILFYSYCKLISSLLCKRKILILQLWEKYLLLLLLLV
jgi:hypothetical protein